MKVLIIYELIPEDTIFCIVENPSKEEINLFDRACGSIVNGCGDIDAASELNEYIDGRDDGLKFSENRLEIMEILNQQFDRVVWSGFNL